MTKKEKLMKNPKAFFYDMKMFRKLRKNELVKNITNTNTKPKAEVFKNKLPFKVHTRNEYFPYYLVIDWKDDLSLAQKVSKELDINLVSFKPFQVKNKGGFKKTNEYVEKNPEEYDRFIKEKMLMIPKKIKGVIVFGDLEPMQRRIVEISNSFNIPSYLFCQKNSFGMTDFYVNENAGYSKPAADKVFVLNEAQKQSMLERGVLEEKISVVGSLIDFEEIGMVASKELLFDTYGLDEDRKKIFIYIKEELKTEELAKQIVSNLDEVLSEHNVQVIASLPKEVISNSKSTISKFKKTGDLVLINEKINNESLKNIMSTCEMVVSNSNAKLFEGLEMLKHVIQLTDGEKRSNPYVIPVNNIEMFYEAIVNNIEKDVEYEGIVEFVENNELNKIEHEVLEELRKDFSKKDAKDFFEKREIRTIGFNMAITPSLMTNFKYTDILLGADSVINLHTGKEDVTETAIWALGLNPRAQRIKREMERRGVPCYHLENGFIASVGLTTADDNPSISILKDRKSIYFDALNGNEMEDMIKQAGPLEAEEKKRIVDIIDKIIKNNITKYNHAPIFTPNIGVEGRKKVLVIDQRAGDKSIEYGMANAKTFDKMLNAAIKENPGADVIVKVHPDAIIGGKEGHYYNVEDRDGLILYGEDINPISLLQYVDKVYVCTSQMGFEALMCGKEVVCFGVPFYSGWGLTEDKVDTKRRGDKRTIEQIFKVAYMQYSTYMNPKTNKVCEIEDAIDYLINEISKRKVNDE